MTGMEFENAVPIVQVPEGMTELVRGEERSLLDRLEPLVKQESLELDLNGVERIDAAGLAALITLYRDASQSGHAFRVTRLEKHVREILGLVGLDRMLTAAEAEGERAEDTSSKNAA